MTTNKDDLGIPEYTPPIIPTTDQTDGIDPRQLEPTPTKGSLKRFEFTPRGDLSSYHIPKKPSQPSHSMSDEDGVVEFDAKIGPHVTVTLVSVH